MFCIIFNAGCKKEIPDIWINLSKDEKLLKSRSIEASKIPLNNIGYIIFDPKNNKVITSHNRRESFIPASVTKIPTTAAALKILGSDYRFKTILARSGTLNGGILTGTLYLKGTGDPLLKVSDLSEMVLALKKAGIQKVSGKFIFDDTELHKSEMTDHKMQNEASYNTGIGALSMDFNIAYAKWDKDKVTKKIDFYLTPSIDLYRTGIAGKKFRDEMNIKFENSDDTGIWLLSPDVKGKGSKPLPIKDPGIYTAKMFVKLAGMEGVAVPSPAQGKMPEDASLLHVHLGRPLIDIVEIIMTYSNNLMAELLHLAAAKKLTGKTLDLAESGVAISEFYHSKIKNIKWDGFKILNGSGLTGKNRITPEQMIGLLLFADSEKYGGRSFFSLMPISGWKGSLEGRLSRPETAFHVWAKTGGINYALSLSGLLYTLSNKQLIFSIFISDMEARNILESDGISALKDNAEKKAHSWSKKYTQLIDDLLLEWILEL